jgi:hypothetical protein
MKDINPAQIERLQYNITADRLTLLITLRSRRAFNAIPLPEITHSSGEPYKARTLKSETGASIKVFFYPPVLLASAQAQADKALEPERVDIQPFLGA